MRLPRPTLMIHRGPESYGFTFGYEHRDRMGWSSLLSVRWWSDDCILSIFVRGFGHSAVSS